MVLYRYLSPLVFLSAAIVVKGTPTEKLIKHEGQIVEIPPIYLPTSQKKVQGTVVPEHITVSYEELLAMGEDVEVPPSPEIIKRSSNNKRFIGTDDRVYWDRKEYPWGAAGRLISSTAICSASLVGSRHISTARHCIGAAGATYRFQPAYNKGEVFPGASVTHIYSLVDPPGYNNSCHTRDDWAIMVLDAPLGNDRGFFGARVIDDTLIGLQNVWSYGYPGDLDPTASTPYAQGQRTIRPFGITANADCGKYGPIVSDIDAGPGQSGSAMWILDTPTTRYQLGVVVAATGTDAFSSSGPLWVNMISRARTEFP